MQVHGIILVEGEFNRGETISVAGADLSGLSESVVRYGDGQGLEGVVGYVTDARRIMGPEDCVRNSDWALLDVAHGRPFVRASARFVNSGMLPFIRKAGLSSLTWSAVGVVFERVGDHIARSRLRSVALGPARGDVGAYRLFEGAD